jgi:hypothetical protein
VTVVVNVGNGGGREDVCVNVDVVVASAHVVSRLLKLLVLPHPLPDDRDCAAMKREREAKGTEEDQRSYAQRKQRSYGQRKQRSRKKGKGKDVEPGLHLNESSLPSVPWCQ